MSDFYNKYPYTDFHELNLDWVIERVKKLTEDWAATLEEWNSTEEQWQELYNYVHDYFDNLDVQQEINNKINAMIADGTFVTITTPVIEAKVASMMPSTVASQIGDTVASQIGATVAGQIGATVASQIDAAVVNPVNAWLNTHITQPTTPAVDTSLSITGAAADAAVVGKNLSELFNDDAGIEFLVVNLNNSIRKIPQVAPTISAHSGNSITFNSSTSYSGVAFKINVMPNTSYQMTATSSINGYIDVTDKNQSVQLVASGINGTTTLSFNSGANEEIMIRPGLGGVSGDTSITFSNISIKMNPMPTIDATLSKTNYAADAKAVGDELANLTALISPDFNNSGFMNYFGGVFSYKSDSNWRYTDFIPISAATEMNLSHVKYYGNGNDSIAVCLIAFFDLSKNFVGAFTNINGDPVSQVQGFYTGVYTNIPAGAAYFRLQIELGDGSVSQYRKYISDEFNDVSATLIDLQDQIDTINDIQIYEYKNKINVIGDSISQGVGVEVTYENSYCGLLRKMLMIENDLKMNYGFEPFPAISELTTVTETMINRISTAGFSRIWNSSDVYGSDEYTSNTIGASIVFSINHKFNKISVSYKGGVEGVFTLNAGDTVLQTVSVTSGTVEPLMSTPVSIESYDINQQYSINVVSGTVSVSGVALIDDTSYPIFNNYGRAGIPVQVVEGTLLTKESDCDILIYALGTNGSISDSDINSISTTLNASHAKKIILDLCMKSSQHNNIAKSAALKQIADNTGAAYIRMYDIIPKNGSGITDSSYFISDGLHPSPKGHRCIADVLGKYLKLSCSSSGLANATFTEW